MDENRAPSCPNKSTVNGGCIIWAREPIPTGKPEITWDSAQSTDLLHWQDATDKPVLDRRPDAFDSRVMEPGPPPVLTDAGILLLYNGANESLIYSPGWVLFDKNDPRKIVARAEAPFLVPTLRWEVGGQVPNVIFLEGAIVRAKLKNRLVLTGYYGAADKYIGAMGHSDSHRSVADNRFMSLNRAIFRILACIALTLPLSAFDDLNQDQIKLLQDPGGWEYTKLSDDTSGVPTNHTCFDGTPHPSTCSGTLTLDTENKFIQQVIIEGQAVARKRYV